MQPLVITAAPYAPAWRPGYAADIAVTWDEQVQAAVDCYNAGATVLHLHVRNPATGHLSADFDHFNYLLERLKQAVPKMIIQVGGSISFAPKGEGKKAAWLDYDTRLGRLGRLCFGRLRLIFRTAILRSEAFAHEAPLSDSSDNECYRHPATAEGNKDRECPSIG